MRFLADMGVDIRVVDWLRDSGHEAIHLREHGMHRASDRTIFAKAMAEDRIVITFDLDFGTLAALARDRSPSIVLFRLSNARLATVIAGGHRARRGRGRACPTLGHSRRGHSPADPGSPDRRSLIPRPRGALLLTNGSKVRVLDGPPLERAWPPRLPRGNVTRSARRARSASDHF